MRKTITLFSLFFFSVSALAQYGAPGGYGNSKFTKELPLRDSDFSFGVISSYHSLRNTDTGATGIYHLASGSMIQGSFVLSSTDPVIYGIAGAYKATISGDAAEGFHLGGGLGFGSFAKDKNFIHVNGIAGFHFSVGRKVLIHIDTGFTIANADSKTSFLIGGHSPIFGLSLLHQL